MLPVEKGGCGRGGITAFEGSSGASHVSVQNGLAKVGL